MITVFAALEADQLNAPLLFDRLDDVKGSQWRSTLSKELINGNEVPGQWDPSYGWWGPELRVVTNIGTMFVSVLIASLIYLPPPLSAHASCFQVRYKL